MSKNNKTKNYILFTLGWSYSDNSYKWTPTYYSWSGLIHRIAQSEVYGVNPILANLSSDMSETSCKKTVEVHKLYCSNKEYVYTRHHNLYYICKVCDNKMYDIDYIKAVNDITLEIKRITTIKERKAKAREADARSNRYEFRREAVPGIHNYKSYHRGTWYRRPKLGRVKREAEIVEYKEFRKPKDRAVNLPLWDDKARCNDKSWKTSYKVKKQWQKHKNNHMDVVKISKRHYEEDDVEV
ncbi:MAG: hypothetical protein J6A59_12355 [Lachnospiraceae bacterium]|nr:hypothetical protein [Lachnospiraceae bacterium]